MHITHVYHSGFAIELDSCSLVLDYYTGELPPLPTTKPLYVLVSHAHADHYGSLIWDLRSRFDQVSYVVDAAAAELAPRDADVTAVRPHQAYQVGQLQVSTLESNDEGVAFLVEVEGRSIYFAGDLNVWWWDRPLVENEASDAFCRGELARIPGPVDVAFVPVDPRLADPLAGIVAFAEEVGAATYVPMHYWDEASTVRKLSDDPRVSSIRQQVSLSSQVDA